MRKRSLFVTGLFVGVTLLIGTFAGAMFQQSRNAVVCFGAGSGSSQTDDRLPIPGGNPANRWFLDESQRMNDCMQTHVDLYYSPTLFNAFADPDADQVVLGLPLQRKAEMEGRDAVGLGMGFILAHEFGHAFQFRIVNKDLAKLGTSTPVNELQADVLAGYWAGARIHEQRRQRGTDDNWEAVNKALYLRYAASFGDFAFTSRSHHGTPHQRHNATQIGFEAGQSGKFGALEKAYSDNGKELFDWSRARARSIANSLL